MIPMKCPKCEARGEIPIDKLGMRLHCRKCGSHFYMDATGGIYLGDPADASQKPKKKVDTHPTEPIDLNPLSWLKSLPVGARIGLGVVVAIGLIGFGVSMVTRSMTDPGSLTSRSAKLAELFIDMRLDDIKPFATTESTGSIRSWYDVTRSAFAFPKQRTKPTDATAFTLVRTENEADGETFTTVITAEDPNKPGHTFSYPLMWKRVDGVWLVDFKASEKAYNDGIRRSIEAQRREEQRQRSRGVRR
jgi:hypothetical protein